MENNGIQKNRVALSLSKRPPQSVPPGGSFALRVRACCPESPNLENLYVELQDEKGAPIRRLRLMFGMPDGFDTDMVAFQAPTAPGDYTWNLVFHEQSRDGEIFGEARLPLSFAIPRTHTLKASVWNVPGAVETGADVSLCFGVKCIANCDLAGREARLFNSEGKLLTAKPLNDEPAGISKALYWTEFCFKAPLGAGTFGYRCSLEAPQGDSPHSQAEAAFSLLVEEPGDCSVRIRVLDRDSGAPLPNIKVLLRPYSARTNGAGEAELRVKKGKYRLVATGKNDIYGDEISVTEPHSTLTLSLKELLDERFFDCGG